MKITKKIFTSIMAIGLISGLFAEDGVLFKFKHNKGDAIVHVSTVEEEAYINGRLNNRTEFINRTSTTISEVRPDGAAKLFTHYMTTQNNFFSTTGRMLSWGEEESVRIFREPNGQLHDSDNDYLPTVQSIPSFPDYEVKPGDSWTSDGLEVHDCRALFNMDEAIQIPFTATYTYIGDEETEDATLQLIQVEYKFLQNNLKENIYKAPTTFAAAQGESVQKIWWDNDKGDLDHYSEEFAISMMDTQNNVYTFHGIAHGEVTEYKSVNDKKNVRKLQKKVEKYKLDNISVKQGEKGLTISLDNIQFEPDSDVLLPSELKKPEKIGEILQEFSNDLLITGHCAQRGSERAQQKLSEERAEAVASFLVKSGIRDELHIFTQGKGAKEPVASNATEEGRAKNRRVEITIMD